MNFVSLVLSSQISPPLAQAVVKFIFFPISWSTGTALAVDQLRLDMVEDRCGCDV
jgi:hypothetical protein